MGNVVLRELMAGSMIYLKKAASKIAVLNKIGRYLIIILFLSL